MAYTDIRSDHDLADWLRVCRDKYRLPYRRLPDCYQDGVLLGSGVVGASCYQSADTRLTFLISRSDVYSRNCDIVPHRKPIGSVHLTFSAAIESVDLTLDLANAMLTGTISTGDGEVQARAYCHALDDDLVVKLSGPAARQASWELDPDRDPQPTRKRASHPYDGEPLEHASTRDWSKPDLDAHLFEVTYNERGLVAGQTVVATQRTVAGDTVLCRCAIHYDRYLTGDCASVAEARLVDDAWRTDTAERTHRETWHRYTSRTFIALPDTRFERFVDFQLYKLRCLTRPGGNLIDIQGVWFDPQTPWAAVWHNLNSQLTYGLCAPANRLDLVQPLIDAMVRNSEQFEKMGRAAGPGAYALNTVTSAEFVPAGPDARPLQPLADAAEHADGNAYHGPEVHNATLGNFLWLVHTTWQAAAFSGDEQMPNDVVLPFVEKGLTFYLAFLEERSDGRLHLPATFSPEYRAAEDCSYDLAVLRWGLKVVDEYRDSPVWSPGFVARADDVRARLVDYAYSFDTGYMIGADVELTDPHRHYSHLLMIHPFFEKTVDEPAERGRMGKSIDHWQSFSTSPHEPHPKMVGYSFTGAASLYAALGDGERALTHLDAFLATNAGGRLRPSNTQYYEHAGEAATTVEVPLTFASAVMDMLLQSRGGVLRVFPAVPEVWEDVAFFDLQAEGGFLVSAVRQRTKLVYLRIFSPLRAAVRVSAAGLVDLACEEHRGAQSDEIFEVVVQPGTAVTFSDPTFVLDDFIHEKGRRAGAPFLGLP